MKLIYLVSNYNSGSTSIALVSSTPEVTGTCPY